ncbi:FRG domain-containing protein [Pseudomonas sivasensis]|uniref:FRG domain-containing protein n=1 Tax=Pseudomonas sivasensis TaxID=1880678 RepID=UPI0015C46A5F|nr:FRG domain-containing protein [Pseudomonas sivasensis]
MKSIPIKDVPEFLERISVYDLVGGTLLFRGQSKRGNLLPGVARKDPAKNTTAVEKAMLGELRKQGLTMIPSYVDITSDWDMLVLAQHFQLKTRLLDWTSNALAAMWFACSSRGTEDCYVYTLEADSLMLTSLKGSPFTQKKTRVINPNLSNDRIIAQSGYFTAHRFSEKSGKFVALEKNPDVKNHLIEYVIAGNDKVDFLMTLERCGVTSKSIYPDIEGLCRFLNWRMEGSY